MSAGYLMLWLWSYIWRGGWYVDTLRRPECPLATWLPWPWSYIWYIDNVDTWRRPPFHNYQYLLAM